MKILIVFTSFILIFTMAFVFILDFCSFKLLSSKLKYLAEDSAHAGALCFDEDNKSIDYDKCMDYAAEIINKSRILKDIDIEIADSRLTDNGMGFEIYLKCYISKGMFHLITVKDDCLIRGSKYIWK